MAIKALIFDFGNVIGFFSHRKATERLAAHSPVPVDVLHAQIFGGELEDSYERGRITTAQFLAQVRQLGRLTCSDDFLRHSLEDMFWPNESLCALIPTFKPKYRLVLASNTNELHSDFFLPRFADTLRHFDEMVLSHKIGARKPSAEFFAHCQKQAGCTPSECLFLDDLEANVAGARAFGWQGIVYRASDDIHSRLAEFGVTVNGVQGGVR